MTLLPALAVRSLPCCWSTPPRKDALAIAERIRLAVNAEQNPLPERMTISMGLYTTRDRSVSAETYVERADAAMYEAKNSGRNRVVVWRHPGD